MIDRTPLHDPLYAEEQRFDFCLDDTGVMTGHATDGPIRALAATRDTLAYVLAPDAHVRRAGLDRFLPSWALNYGTLMASFPKMALIARESTAPDANQHSAVVGVAVAAPIGDET
jgi:hypothetical protein